jgi:probable phosphoglycerate mutase
VLLWHWCQGLLKDEGKAKFGDAFRNWQKKADTFSIDGHAPVRELWYRASLAWHSILNPEQQDDPAEVADSSSSSSSGNGEGGVSSSDGDDWRCALVVAHNAVNQAMIGAALGLPPRYFRRLLQVGQPRATAITPAHRFSHVSNDICGTSACVH